MKNAPNNDAAQAYATAHKKLEAALARVTRATAAANDPHALPASRIHWAHVGTLMHFVEQLEELANEMEGNPQ